MTQFRKKNFSFCRKKIGLTPHLTQNTQFRVSWRLLVKGRIPIIGLQWQHLRKSASGFFLQKNYFIDPSTFACNGGVSRGRSDKKNIPAKINVGAFWHIWQFFTFFDVLMFMTSLTVLTFFAFFTFLTAHIFLKFLKA